MKTWAVNLAIKTARKSTFLQHQHGAVAISGGRLIAKTVNQLKSFIPQSACSIHAEIALIREIKRTNVGCVDLYVVQIYRDNVKISKPCPKCEAAIRRSGLIRRVFYSMNDNNWGYMQIA